MGLMRLMGLMSHMSLIDLIGPMIFVISLRQGVRGSMRGVRLMLP